MRTNEHELVTILQRINDVEQALDGPEGAVGQAVQELQDIILDLLQVEGRIWEGMPFQTPWRLYHKFAQATGWRDAAEVAFDYASDAHPLGTDEAKQALRSALAFLSESAASLIRLQQGLPHQNLSALS